MGYDTANKTLWGELEGNGPQVPRDASNKRAVCGTSGRAASGRVSSTPATPANGRIDRYAGTTDRPASHPTAASARRRPPACTPTCTRRTKNRGFRYHEAMAIVRPDITRTPEDRSCGDRPLGAPHHTPSTTVPADAIPGGHVAPPHPVRVGAAQPLHVVPGGKWTRSGNRSEQGVIATRIRPEISTILQKPTSAQHASIRPTLSRGEKGLRP